MQNDFGRSSFMNIDDTPKDKVKIILHLLGKALGETFIFIFAFAIIAFGIGNIFQ